MIAALFFSFAQNFAGLNPIGPVRFGESPAEIRRVLGINFVQDEPRCRARCHYEMIYTDGFNRGFFIFVRQAERARSRQRGQLVLVEISLLRGPYRGSRRDSEDQLRVYPLQQRMNFAHWRWLNNPIFGKPPQVVAGFEKNQDEIDPVSIGMKIPPVLFTGEKIHGLTPEISLGLGSDGKVESFTESVSP